MLRPLETRAIEALKSAGVTWASFLLDSEYNAVLTLGDGTENGILTNKDLQRAGLQPTGEDNMKVRAKFVCSFVDPTNKTVYLGPVYSGSDENKRFFAATPGGQIMLHVLNDSAAAAFQQGKEYYIDFTPAEEN